MHCRMHCMSAGICSTVVMSSDTVTIAVLFGNNKACCQQAKVMHTVTFANNRAPHMAVMAIEIHKVCDS